MNPYPDASAGGGSPGRNHPCPCGSGLRYKECHGRLQPGGAPVNTAGISQDQPAPDADIRQVSDQQAQRHRELAEQAVRHFNAGEHDKAEPLAAEILNQAPWNIDALRVAVLSRRAAGDLATIDRLFARAINSQPRNADLLLEHAEYLESAQAPARAEQQVARALDVDARNYRANLAFGRFQQHRGRTALAAHHFRIAHNARPAVPEPAVLLADCLTDIGRGDEAEHYFRVALALDPSNVGALVGWARLEEGQKDLERAADLLARAKQIQPNAPIIALTESVIHRRNKRFDEAFRVLEVLQPGDLIASVRVLYFYERGSVCDKLGQYDEAFSAYSEANRINREELGLRYAEEKNRHLTKRLQIVFDRQAVALLPAAKRQSDLEEKPIFICGFTRSGTSLMEQILASHPGICAGDELHYMGEIIGRLEMLAGGSSPYPDCMTHASDNAIQEIRNEFLTRSRIAGLLVPGVRRFTDKTPGNELHMGLLARMFPEARFVHMVRHPLDSVLASFFIDCRHGDVYSSDLKTTAIHYVRCMDMVAHYLGACEIDYLRVHYEKLVEDVEARTREVLEFLDEPFDEACVRYYETERHARTPSYAQVKQKPYTDSINRHRNYRRQVEPIIPILEPWIKKLGYTVS